MDRKFKIAPRWLIFLLDLCFTSLALLIAYVVKSSFASTPIDWYRFGDTLILLGIVNSLVFLTLRSYSGIVRYTGIQDAFRLSISILSSGLILYLINSLGFLSSSKIQISFGILIVYAVFSLMSLLTYRLGVKYIFAYLRYYKLKKKNVVIFGAGEAGVATKRVLEHDNLNNINIIAFIDDDRKKTKKIIDGVPIIPWKNLKELIIRESIHELIIASFSLSTTRKNEIVNFCIDHDIRILNIPPFSQWTAGKFKVGQLKKLQIEELLERAPIKINNIEINHQIKGKRVLVTGAAGSIGSEIVRQLLTFSPEIIILCDQAETPLNDLSLQLQELNTDVNCIPFLADITNEQRMNYLFKEFTPHYVYHAAAYKHVPMMEIFPSEAIKNNVIGTKIIADLAMEFNVDRFVMVSTDKAVNPTNVMGATKRLAEIYVQSLSQLTNHKTKFITTRFGNVLGSNGSVINRFKDQIEKGGPITVTHPNITRYFMTIPEACQLVLEAGSMGNGGEIFVFDMGDAVQIAELAKKMIRLYNLIPNIDIDITYTGLRPGEKLYEELLNQEEMIVRTYHKKIMIAKVRIAEYDSINQKINQLFELIHDPNENSMTLVFNLKNIIPEFLSNNSIYEELDQ